MEDQLILGAARFALDWIAMVGVFLVVGAIELAWNRQPMPLKYRLQALVFQTVYLAVRVAFLIAVWRFVRPYLPRATFDVPPLVAGLLGLLIYDFCYYWMHRAQHQIPLLWKFHRTHHSIEHMGAGTGYHHVSQIVVELACLSVPLILFAPSGGAWMIAAIGYWGAYLHTTSRLNLGPLGGVLIDNRVHRIHHSLEPQHFNKNFGVPLTLWDRVFGTFYMPAKDEWPDVGLDDTREPQGVGEFLLGRQPATQAGAVVLK